MNNTVSHFTKKQQDVLDTAMRLFNEYGFVSVGIDRIIAEANVAKMTFYKHFPTKEQLIIQSVREWDKQMRTSILDKLNQKPKTLTRKSSQLRLLFDWYQAWFKQSDFFGSIFIKASNEFPHHDILHELVRQHKNWLNEQIATLLRQENIKNAEELAIHISVILDGAIINESITPNQHVIERAWRMTQILLENAKAKEASNA